MRAFFLEGEIAAFTMAWWTERFFVAVDGALVVHVPKEEGLGQSSSKRLETDRPSLSLPAFILTSVFGLEDSS